MKIQDLALISAVLQEYYVPNFVISCLKQSELTEKQKEALQNILLAKQDRDDDPDYYYYDPNW